MTLAVMLSLCTEKRMSLNPTEEEMSRLGATRFFLGERSEYPVDVALHLRDFTLPQLDRLIADSDEPIFDELSRAAIEITLENIPPGIKMRWELFEDLFGEAIHGPERFGVDLQFAPEGPAFLAFVDKIRALAAKYRWLEGA